ncbi:MAG: hypothetical protein LJE94_14375 [Deltaproteobacteria bacterium]|nr:hypothetical protein [Deltaproteobacteria bacterium]
MTRKKRRPASFDAMVKFFIRNYDIPTRRDVDILMEKLDRLESLIKAGGHAAKGPTGSGAASPRGKGGSAGTAAETVYQIICKSRKGVGFADISAQTGFGEKKVRNTIYRLHNTGKITRKSRGIYVAT